MANRTEMNKIPKLNETLTRMWEINNKAARGEQVSEEEVEFFNEHLDVVEAYYTSRSHYWKIQTSMKYVPPKV